MGRHASILALLLTCLVARAQAHGYLAEPPARNLLANTDYCPQCLSAGGPAVVSGGAVWPNGKNGICGDPAAGPLRHEVGGAMYSGRVGSTGQYTEGQVINVTVVITAFHKGRFGLRICRISGTEAASEKAQLTEACLNQHILRQAAVPEAQLPGDAYYHLGQTPTPTLRYNALYQLPQGLTCDGVSSKCVMQWWWLTGNSCDPPNEPAPFGSPALPKCGAGAPYPEEFWNCADVLILPGGSTIPTATPSSAPSPSPTLMTTPSPMPIPDPSPIPATFSSPIPDPHPHLPSSSGIASASSPCPSGDAVCYCILHARDGMFADALANCTSYYWCMGSTAVYRSCPPGLLFNDQQLYCDWPERVAASSPAATPTPATSPAAFCAAKRAFGFFADPSTSCVGFYRCEASGSWYFSCRSDLRFNEAISACDWAHNVPCPGMSVGRRMMQG